MIASIPPCYSSFYGSLSWGAKAGSCPPSGPALGWGRDDWKKMLVAQSYWTLCDPMKCSPGFPGGASDKAGDIRVAGLLPGSGRSSGGGHGNPPQCSCLENSHGQRSLAGYSQRRHKSWTRLKRLSMHTCTDCSLPGSSLHGTLQVRRLEWVAIPFSRGSFWTRDWTQVSRTAGGFFTISATWEALGDDWTFPICSCPHAHTPAAFLSGVIFSSLQSLGNSDFTSKTQSNSHLP